MKDKSVAISLLRIFGFVLPGNWLKTFFYLNLIKKPRQFLRLAIHRFYRMDHVYDVVFEARREYSGKLSILEFGTNEGYAFRKLLYAVRYAGLEDRVVCHGFDTFSGIPEPADRRDINIVADRVAWSEGQFQGGYEKLHGYCTENYKSFDLHQGLFEDTLTPELLQTLAEYKPILVWIDCDFYSASRTVIERIVDFLPNGCVVYFDEFEFNFGSKFAGEARVVHELNSGMYGDGIELILDTELSMDSRRVYRFVRFEGGPHYEFAGTPYKDEGRSPTNDSALP